MIGTRTEFGKIFDYAIIYCMSVDMKIVERVYIFPWEEVISRISSKSLIIKFTPRKLYHLYIILIII